MKGNEKGQFVSAFDGEFMQPEVYEGYPIDEDGNPDQEGEYGFYARLSAPGYLDCTDWHGPFGTEQKALKELRELYANDI